MFSYGRLKSLRESRGISQKELSEQIGVSDVMVSMYEQGKKNPSIDTISKIADYFSVSVDYLLGKELTDDSLSYDKLLKIYTRGKNNLTPEEKIKLAQIILNDRNDGNGLR